MVQGEPGRSNYITPDSSPDGKFLIAAGAILTFAVSTTVSGAALPTIGVILMVVGGIGILMAMLFLMSFSPWGTHETDHVDPHTHVH